MDRQEEGMAQAPVPDDVAELARLAQRHPEAATRWWELLNLRLDLHLEPFDLQVLGFHYNRPGGSPTRDELEAFCRTAISVALSHAVDVQSEPMHAWAMEQRRLREAREREGDS